MCCGCTSGYTCHFCQARRQTAEATKQPTYNIMHEVDDLIKCDGLVHETPDMPDPWIAGRPIRVLFPESQYNYQTDINGTRKSVCAYFRGALLNVASYPNETMRTPCRIEFLDNDHQTIAVELKD